MIDFEKLKVLAEAATPGPWAWDGRTVDGDGYVHIPECSYLVGNICLAGDYEGYQEDCDYMAAASPDTALALIARIADLQAKLAAAEARTAILQDAHADCAEKIHDLTIAADEHDCEARTVPSSSDAHSAIGKLTVQFSALPVLWGLDEPGALVRHRDVFDILVAASKEARTVPAQTGTPIASLPVGGALDAERAAHDVADRLALWLSSSMDQHSAVDEMRKHIRAWIDFQPACARAQQAGAGQAVPEDSSMPHDMSQAKRWIVQLRGRVDSLLAVINAAPLPPQSAAQAEDTRAMLEFLVNGDVGRATLATLATGQGTLTVDGIGWLAAAAYLAKSK